jgi:nucleotide-binding universal stress UspA family protein
LPWSADYLLNDWSFTVCALFNCIVVGTDGSETADAAVELAISVARENNATLHIVNAFRTPSGTGQVPVTGVLADNALGQAVGAEVSKQLVAGVASRAEGVNVKTHSVNQSAPEAVLEVAEAVGADLIVVGNKGIQRRVLGSVPNTIAHKAPCNLLIAKTT